MLPADKSRLLLEIFAESQYRPRPITFGTPPSNTFDGWVYTAPGQSLSTAGVRNAIDLWLVKYHRQWGNPMRIGDGDIVHGIENCNLVFTVVALPDRRNKMLCCRDVEDVLAALVTYVNTHRHGVWGTTVGTLSFRNTQTVRIDFRRRGI